MQLVPPPAPGDVPADVATGLREATDALGFRPAVTVVRAGGREEQGVASLAQWAAKGAHLLEVDLGIGPGDRLHLDVAVGWPLAAVCLAVWWAGATITVDGNAEVAVVDEGRTPPPGAADVLWTGAAVDGAPTSPAAGEAWAVAVQPFPDAPPPARAAPDLPALVGGTRRFDQRELLADAAALGDRRGPIGVDATDLDPVLAILAVAARPIAARRPTVVLDGVGREAAAADRVAAWLP